MPSLINDPQKLQRSVGWDAELSSSPAERERLHSYIAFQMASAGLATPADDPNEDSMAAFSAGILDSLKEKNRLLAEHRTGRQPNRVVSAGLFS